MSFIKKVLGARGGSKRGVSKRAPVGAMLPRWTRKAPVIAGANGGLDTHGARGAAARHAAVTPPPARAEKIDGEMNALSIDHHRRIERFVNELTRRFGTPASITLRQPKPKGRHDMEYDNRNKGVLFNERDKKTGDNDRDYAGTLDVSGVQYWLSAWIKTSKAGRKYMSLSVKPKVAAPAESERKSLKGDLNDEIEF
jgi:hypothetical protein